MLDFFRISNSRTQIINAKRRLNSLFDSANIYHKNNSVTVYSLKFANRIVYIVQRYQNNPQRIHRYCKRFLVWLTKLVSNIFGLLCYYDMSKEIYLFKFTLDPIVVITN